MTLIKLITYSFLITYTLGILIYLDRKSGMINWLLNSLNYPFRKRRIDKLFKSLTENNKLVVWQKSIDTEDKTKWYYRNLEKFICEKYIKPILKYHGEI